MNQKQKAFVDMMLGAFERSDWHAMPKNYTKAFSLFTVAQAAVESSWGKDTLSKYNNYFGIKFFGNPTNKESYVSLGASEGGISDFRIFPSVEDCLAFRYRFLTNPDGRYYHCWKIMQEATDETSKEKILSIVKRYGTCIQLAGYCSNDNYGNLLYSLAEGIYET